MMGVAMRSPNVEIECGGDDARTRHSSSAAAHHLLLFRCRRTASLFHAMLATESGCVVAYSAVTLASRCLPFRWPWMNACTSVPIPRTSLSFLSRLPATTRAMKDENPGARTRGRRDDGGSFP